MSWRNGPRPRVPADGERERLPRAIAARLARAGRIAEAPPAIATMAAADRPEHGAPQAPPESWSREVFELIEWRRFEAVVEALFAQEGFEARPQAHDTDGGVDIWMYPPDAAGGAAPVGIVRCRQWMRHKVGVDEVRALRAAMTGHAIERGRFVTTSDFTSDARELAEGHGIDLHDVDGLLRVIATRRPEQQQALLRVAFAADWWRPTCASCRIKLVERTARQSGRAFWGCENHARGCDTQLPMRHRHRGVF